MNWLTHPPWWLAAAAAALAVIAAVIDQRRRLPPFPPPPGSRLVFTCPCGDEFGPVDLQAHAPHGQPTARIVTP